MPSWDNVARELDGMTKALERMIKAFESMKRTYQEMIDFCETYSHPKNQH